MEETLVAGAEAAPVDLDQDLSRARLLRNGDVLYWCRGFFSRAFSHGCSLFGWKIAHAERYADLLLKVRGEGEPDGMILALNDIYLSIQLTPSGVPKRPRKQTHHDLASWSKRVESARAVPFGGCCTDKHSWRGSKLQLGRPSVRLHLVRERAQEHRNLVIRVVLLEALHYSLLNPGRGSLGSAACPQGNGNCIASTKRLSFDVRPSGQHE